MNEISRKIERYIDLSIKFQKSESELFKNLDYTLQVTGHITQNHSFGYIITNDNCSSNKSRSQVIRDNAEKEALFAEEYDEYIDLQKNLKQYYNSLNKLEK